MLRILPLLLASLLLLGCGSGKPFTDNSQDAEGSDESSGEERDAA